MSSDIPKHNISARSAYEQMIGVMLDFHDEKALVDVVQPDVIGYGSAEHEFMKTCQDVQKMARIQSEQLKGKGFERVRKPIEERYFANGNICLILEEFELTIPEMNHHFLLRLSSMLEKKDGKWMVTHFHGSTPDSDIAEEEAFPMEGLRKKNLELEAKIRERTRDLEIEAALERARSQSMLMQHSSELNEVSKVFHEQLLLLGIDSEFSFVWLPDEAANTHLFWTTWAEGSPREWQFKSRSVVYPLDKSEPYTALCFSDWESGQPVHEHFVPPEDIRSFFASWTELLEGAERLKAEFFPEGIYYTEAFMKYGCFGIDIRRSLSDEEKSILHRFAIEFERTYTRFLDLQKAEAQAWEAQVEASLERLRSASMAMQKTEDISGVTIVFLDQLKELNLNFIQAWINVFHLEEKFYDIWFSPLEGVYSEPAHFQLPSFLFEDTTFKSWKAGNTFSRLSLHSKDEVDALVQACDEATASTYFSHFQKKLKLEKLEFVDANYKYGTISISSREKASEKEEDVLHRFAKVFEQTYTRFLDLQKAEAQAREARIETALEKVRTYTMGMRSSEDLSEVASVMFEQMKELGGDLFAFGVVLCSKEKHIVEQWHSLADKGMISPFQVPVDLDYIHQYRYEQWKAGKELFSIEIPEDYIQDHFDKMYTLPSFKKAMEEVAQKGFDITTPTWELDYGASFSHGYLLVSSLAPFQESHIFPRFAKVFEQAYTRFLDLQKAEAQAREAHIEAALERVRSRSMAMQNSEELKEVIRVIFDQLALLDINAEHAGIVVDYQPKKDWHFWVAETQDIPAKITVPYLDLVWDRQFTEAKKEGRDFFTTQLDFEEKNSFYEQLLPHIEGLTKKARDFYLSCPGLAASTVIQRDIGLYIENFSGIPYTEEENSILIRFGKVFQQTYTRFLDLKKAEAQAREAQIETALERVRSRTMGMQNSDELREVVLLINEQLKQLQFESQACNIIILNKETGDANYWVSGFTKDIYPVSYHVPYLDHPYYEALLAPWKKEEAYVVYRYHGAKKRDFDKRFFSETGFKDVHAEAKEAMMSLPEVTLSTAYFANGAIQVLGPEALEEEKALILQRFAKVFDQTYTRFLDLKKAEIQAREAQIELGLEKVRTRAMAMQRSSELSDLVNIVFEELTKLDFALNWCMINIIDAPGLCNTVWASNADTDKSPESYHMLFEDYPFHHAMMEGYLNRKSKYIYTIEGEEKRVYDDYLFTQTEFRNAPQEAQEASRAMEKYVCSFTFSNFGGLQTVGNEPLSDSSLDILERFGRVFDLTYTRFNDLLIAEAQAREAQIETALERVRSRTMAMQHSDELAEASHLLDQEVRGLGIKTWGCAFHIYRENDSIEWFGNEAGLLPTYTVPREGIFKQYYDRGQKGESLLVKEIAGAECIAHYEYMSTLPVVGDVLKQLKKTNGSFPSYQIDHVAYFNYGYLLFITREEVPEAHEIFKRFAKVFEQTYTRFLDLQLKEEQAVKLVEEKQRLEETLSDLQATQKQLIHSEKMASLGELTAGIAHEIQNPLNFVNNFSEVSRELLEELLEEMKSGDVEEVDAIAQDVIQNLEKILHHGKRADSIVKGMLQHSRSGDGKKELTDLTALADEYFRLAYHGLRAKDKSFNSIMETDFDPDLPRVNVVPQDIGRVLLNLITNAFHAVSERTQKEAQGYQPTVWVKTKKTADGVALSVQDNGGGIPPAIRDKIFQPFFTTKPTGEGTGLGLSMSYDIINKGHGGDIKMETAEGEGTVFKIVLPVKQEGK